jgi:hypothetical protein
LEKSGLITRNLLWNFCVFPPIERSEL